MPEATDERLSGAECEVIFLQTLRGGTVIVLQILNFSALENQHDTQWQHPFIILFVYV